MVTPVYRNAPGEQLPREGPWLTRPRGTHTYCGDPAAVPAGCTSPFNRLAMRLLAAVMASMCFLTTCLFMRALVAANPPAAADPSLPVTVDDLPEFLLTTGR